MSPVGNRLILILLLLFGLYLVYNLGDSVKEGFDDQHTESCDYINTQRDWFQDKINTVRTLTQDMSGAIYSTMDIKDENMIFQYDNWEGNSLLTTKLGGKCTTKNTSPECINLATPDKHINTYANLSGTNLLELARLKLLTLDTTLTEELAKLNDTADIVGCTPNYMAIEQKSFSTERDIGYLATNTLRDSLRQLSPYYIDQSILSVLMSYLIDDPRFLSRVNTIPANTSYIHENIEALFGAKGIYMTSVDSNVDLQIKENPALLSSLSNYDTTSLNSGYSCVKNGIYAQLSKA